MMSVFDFKKRKTENNKISMVTCYDAVSAKMLDRTSVDCLLVGDSLAMVIHGHSSTLGATPEMMVLHTEAVARGSKNKYIVGDMPFLSYRKGVVPALECAGALMKAGAHAVKLEGVWGHEEVVSQLVGSGIPVMGHIGLTPQSIHALGGFKVQGRERDAAEDLVQQALKLEELGCFSIVMECVPSTLAERITQSLKIPTIGIGAGAAVDGQVLVLHDLLGFNLEFSPKFLKKYMQGAAQVEEAVNRFDQETKSGAFPTAKESYA